jgi:signal transduction histidine kinase
MAYDRATQNLYYCYKETLVKVHSSESGQRESVVLYDNRDSYFQCLVSGPQGVWASSDFRVMLFQNDKLVKEWDFTSRGDFVHDISLDSHGNLWMAQARNSRVMMMDSGFVIHEYPVPINPQTEVNVVRTSPEGVYVASGGAKSYLFFKPEGDTIFTNISLPVDFVPVSDLNIHDVAIHGDVLWLASTEGLLRYDHRTIKRIDLGEAMTNFSVTSVEVMDEDHVLFSNSFGLVRYDAKTGDFWLYDESAGLPSNTITDHGILVADNDDVWVGTSYGLAFARQPIITNTATQKPYCIEAQVDGIARRFGDGLDVPHGSFITLLFSPITFPENKINLQWKLDSDTVWRSLRLPQLTLTSLRTGEHKLLVRAKKNTGLGWSEPFELDIAVAQPYWQGADFITVILLIVVLIAWTSYGLAARIMKKRREYLQNLVNERTKDLQYANEELMLRNTELDRFVYSASHDLSAPLKSILGLIMVARLDPSGANHEQYLNMMERSVRKLEEFIQEVVSYSRNTRMPVKLEPISFTPFVQNLLQDHQYAPNYEKIHFHISDNTHADLVTDVVRLKIILNNLISNSIKFHVYHDDRKPFVNICLTTTQTHSVLTIEDNGRGIDAIHLQHIFDMFYRGEEQAQGSGLGLYILKESVTKLGGEVEAHSNGTEGSTFIVRLPKISGF